MARQAALFKGLREVGVVDVVVVDGADEDGDVIVAILDLLVSLEWSSKAGTTETGSELPINGVSERIRRTRSSTDRAVGADPMPFSCDGGRVGLYLEATGRNRRVMGSSSSRRARMRLLVR